MSASSVRSRNAVGGPRSSPHQRQQRMTLRCRILVDPCEHVADVSDGIGRLELDGPVARRVALAQRIEESLHQGLAADARDVADTVVEVDRPLDEQPEDSFEECLDLRLSVARARLRYNRGLRTAALLLHPHEHPLVRRLQNLRRLVQDVDARGLLPTSIQKLPGVLPHLLQALEGAEELLVQWPLAVAQQLGVRLAQPKACQEVCQHLLLLVDYARLVAQCGRSLKDGLGGRLALPQLGAGTVASTFQGIHKLVQALNALLQLAEGVDEVLVQQEVLPLDRRPQVPACLHRVLIEEAGEALERVPRCLGIHSQGQRLLDLLSDVAARRRCCYGGGGG
mmetsp:Transcript_68505/g.198747  ORF Transcript_68505/g.198747 Transcript_68505/m.198747 type:complete len:338 (+) Transcript_68505:1013-2026(+)